MAQKKYLMSNGLAFSEQKDMETLRKKALKGWNLEGFRFMGYKLEYGEPEDVIYSIDYRLLAPDEEAEYFEMFSSAGWTHVCSEYDRHIFKAEPGTAPIYSDLESKKEKIERLAEPVKWIVPFLVGMTFVFWLLFTFSSGVVESISRWIFFFFLVLTIPALMTLFATYYHRWKKL